jgi:uncharacterized membrane protein YdjX (TVP38/TMEM64 family)
MVIQGRHGRGFALLAILILFAIYTAISIPVVALLAKWSQPMGEWGYLAGPMSFALVFTILATLMVPSSFMKLVAGALFGFTGGLFAGWLGAMGGALLTFLIGRHLLSEKVQSWVAEHPKMVSLDKVVEEHGLVVTIMIRLSLVIPYNMVNWALGPSKMKTRDYALGNVATVFPTILYAWWGSRLGDIITIGDGTGPPRDALWWSTMIISIVITVGGIIWMDRISRTYLESLIAEAE